MYHGDILLGDTIDIKFTSVNASGVPTTLAGTPVISAYVDNSLTEITAGITLTVDFDGRTGLNNVRVVASSGNGFTNATNVQLVITTGTVSGSSVVGYVVGTFSIGKRSVQVDSTGRINLSKWLDGSPAALVAGSYVAANVNTITAGAITNAAFTAGAIAANTFAAGAIDATAIAANAIGSSELAAGAITAATFAAGAIDASAIAANAIGSSEIAAGAITAAKFAADAIDATALAASAAQEIADEVLNRNVAGGGSGGARTIRGALRALRNKRTIAAGTLTVYQEDDITPDWTAAITTTAGNPISQVDPA